MKIQNTLLALVFLMAGARGAAVAAPESKVILRLPSLFGDNACVQAQRPLNVWGWSSAGDKITVTLAQSAAQAVADKDGRWQAVLPSVPTGGPYELTVRGAAGGEVRSGNILAGEVWLASGQSNMLFPLAKTADAARDLAAASHPALRLFREEVVPSFAPAPEPNGRWVVCTPETAPDFSGVAYFFGQKLQQELRGPVGLIQSAKGGTPIEGWLPPEVWKTNPVLAKIHAEHEGRADGHMEKKYARAVKAWEQRGRPAGKEPSKPDLAQVDQNDASVCYNAGVSPLVPYSLAGFIWYQGEWNAGRAAEYKTLLPVLISEWRRLWGRENLPFYLVQLPGIGTAPSGAVEIKSGWAAIREAQWSALQLPHTGVAVAIDVGGELHPPNKREVGERLARQALAKTYGRKMVADGPLLVSATSGAGELRLKFSGADLVLKPMNGQSGFVIASDDRTFHPAQARIDCDTIVLSDPAVAAPTHARYLWSNNPPVTLFNRDGLPAPPFRTDAWETFTVAPPLK